ncbi:MAG TPA: helix-turn-helix transcriptional regulator [Thermoanaerobaculia bacterium]|nr:helix-turn-helix transcriptional regulator [Thermoanaerobaculia bacterium]
MRTPLLNGLGHALRWLRDRHGKKQYQVAAAAGITKGMLSAYETGRQRPSLETLEKLLDTLGCDLNDLHNAIQIINGRPENMRRKEELSGADGDAGGFAAAGREGGPVESVLGLRGSLPQEEEQALTQMIDGFHRLLRHFHRTLSGLQGGPAGSGEDQG